MLNKVFLIGRLGKDPEVRHFDNDSSVCNFSIATSESYKDKQGNKIDQTEWHNISIWRPGLVKVAEKYLTKGSQVHIEGKLRTRKWEKNGVNHYTTEIIVDSFKMLSSKNSNEQQHQSQVQQQQTSSAPEENFTDDLPF